MQTTYVIENLYPEFTKKSYNLIRKQLSKIKSKRYEQRPHQRRYISGKHTTNV